MKIIGWCALTLLFATCMRKQIDPPKPLLPVPSASQMAWHEMETNAFIHFSINTFTDKEWGSGDEDPALFNPIALNTEQWVSTLKEAGFKMIILTCKHHDGFCLWPSRYTRHSIASSPYKKGKGDIVKELSDAVKRNGLKFGIYVSPWDRNSGLYGKPPYIDYYRNQLTELFTRYPPISEMWFDGANGGDGYYGGAKEKRTIEKMSYYDWPRTLSLVRTFAPDIIFFSDAGPGVRWVGNESGLAGETNWNTITTDTLYAGKAGIESILNSGSENGKQWVPAEVDVSIRPGWFYHEREDTLVKSPEKLFALYLTSVGRGSTLLLNVPPDKNGLIHDRDVRALQGWRKMLDAEFGTDLAAGATVRSDSWRGNSDQFSAMNVTDGNNETYWTTNDEIRTGVLEIDLKKKKRIKYITLKEYIKLGQRVKSFRIDAWQNDKWKTIATGTTIGYKRILKILPVETSRIKVTIDSAKECPLISCVELY